MSKPQPTLIGLCAADQDYLQTFLEKVQAYASGRLDKEGCAEMADLDFRLPSLRGFLEPEDRGWVYLEVIPMGWRPKLQWMEHGQLQRTQLTEDQLLVWTEDRGKTEFYYAYRDRDKCGEFDAGQVRLPASTLVELTEAQAEELGLPSEFVTLDELLGIRYSARFMSERPGDTRWVIPA